jgi:hypothetical protein
MNVCLIYSGFLRTWDRCMPNHFDNIVKPNDDNVRGSGNSVEAYFHTDKDPLPGGKWGFKHYFIPIPEKLFYHDPFAAHPYAERKSPEGSVYQTLRQWQCNFVAFSIVPSTFDVYVRMRPDLMFNGPLKLQKPEPKTVYIPQGMDYGGINDQCAYGDYDSMKVYYQVFENYHFLWRDKGITFNSEVMQKANLEDKGINVVRFGSPQHDLIR